MNKKGFTLTELLAVIAIIAIISLIAVPNVIDIYDSTKSNNMISDAKRFISLAKLEMNSDYTLRQEDSVEFSITDLNKNGDFQMEIYNGAKSIPDPDGGDEGYYDNSSYVRFYKENNTMNYCIYLVGSKRYLGEKDATVPSCVHEDKLSSDGIVHVK